jgi:hypothetical protein
MYGLEYIVSNSYHFVKCPILTCYIKKMVTKQAKEAQLQQIFRMLLESKTQEEIAHELNIALKTVQRYTQELDVRYGQAQRQKTDDTLFLECQIFKNRMLALYKGLEDTVLSRTSSGGEKAKCAEVAANIAIDVLKMESEGIKAVKELVGSLGYYGNKGNRLLNSIQQKYRSTQELRNNNFISTESEEQSDTTERTINDNRQF